MYDLWFAKHNKKIYFTLSDLGTYPKTKFISVGNVRQTMMFLRRKGVEVNKIGIWYYYEV